MVEPHLRGIGIALLLTVSWLIPVPTADAQIHSWRDEHGTLVLSNRPRRDDTLTFAVGDGSTVRTTRPTSRTDARPYDRLIQHHSTAQGVRADLVRAVIRVESGFNPGARSPKGAMGLMQLMPRTAAELGVVDAFDPAENIRGGVTYLRQLLTKYDGDEELALAAYNAGPGAVERHGNRVPPYDETRSYLDQISEVTAVGGPPSIYKTIEIVDGRPVPKYSNVKPTSQHYEVVTTER